jgi:hypothetical protein
MVIRNLSNTLQPELIKIGATDVQQVAPFLNRCVNDTCKSDTIFNVTLCVGVTDNMQE